MRFEESTSNTINNFVANKNKLIISQSNKIQIVDNKNALIERSLPIKSDINIISSEIYCVLFLIKIFNLF